MSAAFLLLSTSEARAQEALSSTTAEPAVESPPPVITEPVVNSPEVPEPPRTKAEVAVSGYVETFFQWSFGDPGNGITNYRGFDNRHNAFTIANAVLDASGRAGPVSARLALQVGHTPETYYLAEPLSIGAGGAGTTDASAWRLIQQANVGYRAPIGVGLLIEGGVFLSPIGPESMAIKDQWNWSRSNLFFGLPFYHTGLKLSYPLGDEVTLMVMACNGWNSVVDNNSEKSFALEATYVVANALTAHVLYFAGVERGTGAPEGRAWRHLFDAYATWTPLDWLAINVHGDVGFESNDFGTSHWAAGALSLRVQAASMLYLAARGDLFYEGVADNGQGRASPIFWPSSWVSAQTLTADLRPVDFVSFRLEYRHDQANGPMFFEGRVETDDTGAFVLDAKSQDTLTLGMTAWF